MVFLKQIHASLFSGIYDKQIVLGAFNGSFSCAVVSIHGTSSFETGISDRHCLIYSMLKTTFEKKKSKKVTCRNYKQFQWETFEKDLPSSLKHCDWEYENYERNFIKVLNTHNAKKYFRF